MFDASFDIFTELSYENSSILLIHSRLYPHTNTHTHTHTHTYTRPNLETGKVSRGSQRGNDGRILTACLSSGRWKKGEENQWGFAARCCKPRAPLYHGPPRKIWKVHGSPGFAVSRPNIWGERDLRGEERVSEDVVIVCRFAIERGLDSRGGDCRGVGEDENHGVASTVSGWRR